MKVGRWPRRLFQRSTALECQVRISSREVVQFVESERKIKQDNYQKKQYLGTRLVGPCESEVAFLHLKETKSWR